MSKNVQSPDRIISLKKAIFLIANSEEVVKELNNSFSCSVKSLNIPINYEGYDSLSENIDHPTLRAIVSVATIQASLQLHRSIKI